MSRFCPKWLLKTAAPSDDSGLGEGGAFQMETLTAGR